MVIKAMFRFDFEGEAQPTGAGPGEETNEPTSYPAAEELAFKAGSFDGDVETVVLTADVSIQKGRLSASKQAALLKREAVAVADLIPSVYEGGFKLWEGALDLCRYLLHLPIHERRQLQSLTVLEMGCGHGLPGILTLRCGAVVHFQDFNAEVLKALTMFNVALAVGPLPPVEPQSSRFFAGEFGAVAALCRREGLAYDRILASEILYDTRSYPSILQSIAQVLKPGGIALIATKAYYFGVGGSFTSFANFVDQDGRFVLDVVWKNGDVANGIRAIVRLTFSEA